MTEPLLLRLKKKDFLYNYTFFFLYFLCTQVLIQDEETGLTACLTQIGECFYGITQDKVKEHSCCLQIFWIIVLTALVLTFAPFLSTPSKTIHYAAKERVLQRDKMISFLSELVD